MGWFAKAALAVTALVAALFVVGLLNAGTPEQRQARQHRKALEAECTKMMADAAPGQARALTRRLCDDMRRDADRAVEQASR
jgi:hypothetical protein